MSIQSIRSKRDSDILLSANHQLEQLYIEQHTPCLALHISRNYHLLEEQDSNAIQQNKWKEKATMWWELYWQASPKKGAALFYDKNGPLFY
ncbi:MAG: hypothetical protein COA95_01760 [Methylophaga sp.]|nr:MAG: hypothetical protein COA95_01760 [Methylophaga sp.]